MHRKVIIFLSIFFGILLLLTHNIEKWKTYNEIFRENVKKESLHKQLIIQSNLNDYFDNLLIITDEVIVEKNNSRILNLLDNIYNKDEVQKLVFMTTTQYFEYDDKNENVIIHEKEYDLSSSRSSISIDKNKLLIQIKRTHLKTNDTAVLKLTIMLPKLFRNHLFAPEESLHYALLYQGMIIPMNFEMDNYPLPEISALALEKSKTSSVYQLQQFTFTKTPLYFKNLKLYSIQIYTKQISFWEYYMTTLIILIFFCIIVYGFIRYEFKFKKLNKRNEKQALSALQLLDNLPVGAVLIDMKKRIKTVNRVALEMFGSEKMEQLIGEHCNETICSRRDGKCPILDLGEEYSHIKCTLLCADNSEKPILKSAVRYFINDTEYLLETFIDITNVEEAEDTIIKTNIAKSLFLSNMSHEIRTPLHAIIGYSEMLSAENLSDEAKKFLDIIYHSSKKLLRIISDILDITKIESGEFHLEKHPTNIYEVMQEMKDIFAYDIEAKSLTFKINIMTNFPTYLLLDPNRIRQVFHNLISNAVKFTEKGSIEVKIEFKEKTTQLSDLKISVSDTGVGIEKSKLQNVFRSFYQEDSKDSRKFGGTGLGLTLTKRIVESMEGSIQVESVQYKGSNFIVYLPNIMKIEHHNNKESSIPNCKDWDILILEDNKTNQYLLRIVLEKLEAKIEIAANGSEGLKQVRKRKPDLIFLDIKMPIMNGDEFLTKLRQQKEFKHIPIIILTASASKECRERLRQNKDVYFLTKPVQKKELYLLLGKFNFLKNHEEENKDRKKDHYKKMNNEDVKSLDELKKEWRIISRTAILEEIKKFAYELMQTAKVNEATDLQKNATSLMQAVDDFDIVQMKKEMQNLKKNLE